MRRLLLSALDQGIVAAFNLSISLILIREAAPAEYGAFMFWQNTAMILISIQSALVLVHLSVFEPQQGTNPARRAAAERMLGSVNLLLVAVVFAAALAVNSITLGRGEHGAVLPLVLALYLAATLLHQYTRALAISRTDLVAVLKIDFAWAVCGWMGIALLWRLQRDIPLTELLALMAGSAVVATVIGLSIQRGGWQLSLRWSVLQQYREVRTDSVWAVLGVVTTELQGRSYIYIIASFYGSAALGELFAAQFLSRPLVVMYVAWSMLARPQLASARAPEQHGQFVALVRHGALLLTTASLLYSAAVYVTWDSIRLYIYGNTYPDLGPVVAAWALITLLMAPNIALSVGLEALREFRLLSLETVYACIVSLVTVAALALAVGYRASLAGLLLSNALGLVLVFLFLRQALRERRGAPGASSPRPGVL
jgi:O-antigen/teichoic acid export membrane protein